MDIRLINYTKDGYSLIANAVRITSPEFDKLTNEEIVKRMVKHDYGSALEHVYFTFDLNDISVALSRELLEHRISSHTAKSTRYVSQQSEMKFFIPKKIQNHSLLSIYCQHMQETHKLYKLLEMQIDRESARYVLPMALQCTYRWTVNVRSLINFFRLRLCKNASPEMQELAQKLYAIVVDVYPIIFCDVGCRGSFLGVCPEPKARSCHKYLTKSEVAKLVEHKDLIDILTKTKKTSDV